MRSKITALSAAALLSLAGWGVQAMPAQVANGASTASPLLTLVAQGCGPGFRIGAGGVCRPIGAVVVRRPAVVVGGPVVVRRPIVRRPGCGVRVGPIGVRTPC